MWQKRQVIISRREPELGFGAIVAIDHRRSVVDTYFQKTREYRSYSLENAPLQRFIMQVGDQFFDGEGTCHTVEKIEHAEGIVSYFAVDQQFWEDGIIPKVADQGNCLAQLLLGQTSDYSTYDLRRQAWQLKSASEKRRTIGLGGARVTPLPHQLYIAATVARRSLPRALIADEVGLGKTIEAGLIFSTLKALGKAERVLIVAPESLVNQWVAELYRRFGEVFAILDAERCQQEEASQQLSPFETCQRAIVSQGFFAAYPQRLQQALEHSWDLIIIDEAHHLRWDEENPNQAWREAKALSEVGKGLLLLTATPMHYGLEGQFGLLHLLDPLRYHDCDEFCLATEKYIKTAEIAKAITQKKEDDTHLEQLAEIFAGDRHLMSLVQEKNRNEQWRAKILAAMVDRFGTGRLLFRNRRENLKGFPRRILASHPLTPHTGYGEYLAALDSTSLSQGELLAIASGRWQKSSAASSLGDNPRYQWFVSLLGHLGNEKVLVLCATKEHVNELATFLSTARAGAGQRPPSYAMFHEDLSVIERDKQAAKFVAGDGAQILIASEIGGEGRNFQCTKHLVLMDLPRTPDLLEQRIGRLDRIGQGAEITIHVPWLKDSPEEALFTWYERGLEAFSQPWVNSQVILEYFAEDLFSLFQVFFPTHADFGRRYTLLDALVERTRKKVAQVRRKGARGEQFLLDLNSFDLALGQQLLAEVEDGDDDTSVEFFMNGLFQHFGVDFEEFDDRGSLLVRGDSLMFLEKFPGIAEDRDTLLTFDRQQALAREDMLYLSYDHPLVESSLSLLLERNEGAASYCQWERSPLGRGLLLECSFVLEAKGPKEFELTRYLPISCKEVVLTHQGKTPARLDYKDQDQLLREFKLDAESSVWQTLGAVLPGIAAKAETQVEAWAQQLIATAGAEVEEEFAAESSRLRYLLEVNPGISVEELLRCEQRYKEILRAISQASVRLDGVRAIFTS